MFEVLCPLLPYALIDPIEKKERQKLIAFWIMYRSSTEYLCYKLMKKS